MYRPSNQSNDRLDGRHIQTNENAGEWLCTFHYFQFPSLAGKGPGALSVKKVLEPFPRVIYRNTGSVLVWWVAGIKLMNFFIEIFDAGGL